MMSLETLLGELEQQLHESPAEACERLAGAMGFAINLTLSTVKMTSELLQSHSESEAERQWASQCHQQSLIWQDSFRAILKNCLDTSETPCNCLLQQITHLFEQSSDLLAQGRQIRVEDKLADFWTMLLRDLESLYRIHQQLQANDLAWVRSHLPLQ